MSEAPVVKSEPTLHAVAGGGMRPGMNETAILDGLSRVLLADTKQQPAEFGRQAESKRLQAITRLVNAYHNYLSVVANRQMDEITAGDVARLGMILKIVEEIEPSDRLRR
ncbi:hypothetical protein SLNSH_17535 [Alsobacter soli]|uniref:Uncharacterized protein n=1 Tax=Alsobacter soli TaxID=2109933 RepID=A0A2T1HQ17_9HYPH|nr:hypothetical protein [Alsobacter soli]PSC03745.1 hypothetical protein SLNSH_17535 [Alsobacter soli]